MEAIGTLSCNQMKDWEQQGVPQGVLPQIVRVGPHPQVDKVTQGAQEVQGIHRITLIRAVVAAQVPQEIMVQGLLTSKQLLAVQG